MIIMIGTVVGGFVGLITRDIYWAMIAGAVTVLFVNFIMGD